jgi:hypothetical protein
MSNAFSKDYASQQRGLAADIKAAGISRRATAAREANMASEDANVRAVASGYIPGLSVAADDHQRAKKIWRKNSKV